jgi:hypothetical protein
MGLRRAYRLVKQHRYNETSFDITNLLEDRAAHIIIDRHHLGIMFCMSPLLQSVQSTVS